MKASSPVTVAKQVSAFVASVLKKCEFDYVVTVERKGTALLRTAWEAGQHSLPMRWEKVLSSEAIADLAPEKLEGRRILLLDDGIYAGRQIRETALLLQDKRVTLDCIKVAAFAVHENSSWQNVDFKYWSQLNDVQFRAVRRGLLAAFNSLGSLFLDTEHIEIPVELRCGRLQFFDALSRLGPSVEYASAGGRVNLTIYNPRILNELAYRSSLPAYTVATNCVRKIRVVQRDDRRFGIIPIFYPATPVVITKKDLAGLDERLPTLVNCTAQSAFNLVGLFSAVELLRSVGAALKPLWDGRKVDVCLPDPSGIASGRSTASLEHLGALFPDLDLGIVAAHVRRALNEGRLWRKKLHQPAARIEAALGDHADAVARYRRFVEREVFKLSEDSLVGLPRLESGHQTGQIGATFAELLVAATEDRALAVLAPSASLNPLQREALLSCAVDQAVDECSLVPDVAEFPFRDKMRRFARCFRLDGELVRADVRAQVARWRSAYVAAAPEGEIDSAEDLSN